MRRAPPDDLLSLSRREQRCDAKARHERSLGTTRCLRTYDDGAQSFRSRRREEDGRVYRHSRETIAREEVGDAYHFLSLSTYIHVYTPSALRVSDGTRAPAYLPLCLRGSFAVEDGLTKASGDRRKINCARARAHLRLIAAYVISGYAQLSRLGYARSLARVFAAHRDRRGMRVTL